MIWVNVNCLLRYEFLVSTIHQGYERRVQRLEERAKIEERKGEDNQLNMNQLKHNKKTVSFIENKKEYTTGASLVT